MSRINHLQLVLPGALTQLRNAGEQSSATLVNWLRTGRRQRLWQPDELPMARLDPWQQALLHALPPAIRSHGLASATMMLRGEGGPWVPGSCLHVEPVHLQAGMDDLRLVWPPPVTAEEQAALFDSLQPLLAVSGFDLHLSLTGVVGRWYAVHQQQLALETYSPRAGYANRLFDIMPQGTDGAQLRRLMTEAQMLLHDHPVNQRRAQRGLPVLNALWFWGAAPLTLVTQPAAQRVLSNSPYVQGLCEHLHMTCWPLPDDATAALSVDADELLVVVPSDNDAGMVETHWLQPLNHAVQQGQVGMLDIYLDHWRITLRGGRWQHLKRKLSGSQSLETLLS